MKSSIPLILLLAALFIFPPSLHAADTLQDRINALEPIIGGFPSNIENNAQLKSVTEKYRKLKSDLDDELTKKPGDLALLFMRGHLQSMGHNFDYPDAWQGSNDDLSAILKVKPDHIPALVELGLLWVNSSPDLAPKAEGLFRAAQCYQGAEPLEEAQRGLFFAFYFQGKIKEAFDESRYLMQTWPESEKYRQLNKLAGEVLARKKHGKKVVSAPKAGKLTIASCK